MKAKFVDYFMDVADRTALMSTAKRLQVGAVAVRDRRIIACGYNGTAPGEDNICEETLEDGSTKTKDSVFHAEKNLILFSERESINIVDCILFVTHSPCEACALEIIRAGFCMVIYKHADRCRNGIEMLIGKMPTIPYEVGMSF